MEKCTCSRARVERLIAEINERESHLKTREMELMKRINKLEKAVPALIALNTLQMSGALSQGKNRSLTHYILPFSPDVRALVEQVKQESRKKYEGCSAVTAWNEICAGSTPNVKKLEKQVLDMIVEKRTIENETSCRIKTMKDKIKHLEEEIGTTRRQISAAIAGAGIKKDKLELEIDQLQKVIMKEKEKERIPASYELNAKLRDYIQNDLRLKSRVQELEKRETAYLTMLTNAEHMWSEMDENYKKKHTDLDEGVNETKSGINDKWNVCFEPVKKLLKEIEESQRAVKVAKEVPSEVKKNIVATENDVNKQAEANVLRLNLDFKSIVQELRMKIQSQPKTAAATPKVLGAEFSKYLEEQKEVCCDVRAAMSDTPSKQKQVKISDN